MGIMEGRGGKERQGRAGEGRVAVDPTKFGRK